MPEEEGEARVRNICRLLHPMLGRVEQCFQHGEARKVPMEKVLLLLPVVKGHSSNPSKHRQEPQCLLLQVALVARPQKEFSCC